MFWWRTSDHYHNKSHHTLRTDLIQTICSDNDLFTRWVRAGASALFSPITVPRPHLRVLVHGSMRDNTTVCICFLTLHHQEIGG